MRKNIYWDFNQKKNECQAFFDKIFFKSLLSDFFNFKGLLIIKYIK